MPTLAPFRLEDYAQPLLGLADLDAPSNPPPTLLPTWPAAAGRSWVLALPTTARAVVFYPPDESSFQCMVKNSPPSGLWFQIPGREVRAKANVESAVR